jgi:hypothetical protein
MTRKDWWLGGIPRDRCEKRECRFILPPIGIFQPAK